MLSSWGVAVRAVDVAARPEARTELERLGVPRVPAVVVGTRVVHGWNPEALAELLGVAYTPPTRLPVAELARRLDRVLAVAGSIVAQLPLPHLDAPVVPGRDRTARQLAYHVFRLALAFRDAMAERRFPDAWFDEPVPPGLADPIGLTGYGTAVAGALRTWLTRPDACAGTVETFYGPQSGEALLERTVWHAAQHVRQLQALLERLGIRPAASLTAADLAGLPVPPDPVRAALAPETHRSPASSTRPWGRGPGRARA